MKLFFVAVCAVVFLTPFAVEQPEALSSWVMVAIAAVGAVSSMAAANQQGKAAKSAAKRQAAAYDRQMRSAIKRKKRQKHQLQGNIVSAGYSSGVDFSGTIKQHYGEQTALMDEDLKEMEVERNAGATAFRKSGQAAYDASRWQMASAGIQGVGNIYGAGQSAGYWGAGKANTGAGT